MQFSKVSAMILTALAAGAMAAPAPAPVDNAISAPREEAAPGQNDIPTVVKRGFGCPGNAYECSDHCKGLGGGRKGGYCGGPWYLDHPTCICVF